MLNLVLLFSIVACKAAVDIKYLETALDDMQTHFKGNGTKFNRVYLNNLTDCLAMWDDNISIKSQNLGWKGFYDYFASNGTKKDYRNLTDYWGECSYDEFGNSSNCMNQEYYRFDPTPFG